LFLDRLAEALATVDLEAIVIGNSASILHGAPVLTLDVDLLVRDTRANRRKLDQLSDELGGVQTDVGDLTTAIRIHLPDVSVDVLFDSMGGGLTFNSVRSRASRIRVDEHSLTVASLEDVIASKEAVGRAKDLASLPILRDTLRVKNALKKR
jgi:hypothetical protein